MVGEKHGALPERELHPKCIRSCSHATGEGQNADCVAECWRWYSEVLEITTQWSGDDGAARLFGSQGCNAAKEGDRTSSCASPCEAPIYREAPSLSSSSSGASACNGAVNWMNGRPSVSSVGGCSSGFWLLPRNPMMLP